MGLPNLSLISQMAAQVCHLRSPVSMRLLLLDSIPDNPVCHAGIHPWEEVEPRFYRRRSRKWAPNLQVPRAGVLYLSAQPCQQMMTMRRTVAREQISALKAWQQLDGESGSEPMAHWKQCHLTSLALSQHIS